MDDKAKETISDDSSGEEERLRKELWLARKRIVQLEEENKLLKKELQKLNR